MMKEGLPEGRELERKSHAIRKNLILHTVIFALACSLPTDMRIRNHWHE